MRKLNTKMRMYLMVTLLVVSAVFLSSCGAKSQEDPILSGDNAIESTESSQELEEISSNMETEPGTEQSTTEPTTESTTEAPIPVVVKFMGVGDNLIHPPLYVCADYKKGDYGDGEYDFSYLYECLAPELAEADIKFINAETISGGDELGMSGYPSFNTPTANIFDIEEAGFNLVNLANNHALDMGVRGILHARYRWDKTNCITSGINVDEEDRNTYRIFEVNGLKFGFISYTSHTNSIPADRPWRVNYMKEEDIRRDLEQLRPQVDFLIVSAHWGWDDIFNIDDFQRHYAQVFAEMGADLVIGTGPHVLQHIEWFEHEGHQTLVAFSLGNYASGMHGPFNELAGILKCNFVSVGDEKRIEDVELVPTVMHLSVDNTQHSVYKLSDYTEELASTHLLRSMGKSMNLKYLNKILNEQIEPQYLNTDNPRKKYQP